MHITDDRNIANIYSYLGMGSSFGDLLGPLIAGTLSHIDRRAELFNFGLFAAFPYMLPILCLSLIALIAFILILKYAVNTQNDDFQEIG